ncbi:MAG: c-type cytochrome domain-containing protein [Fimbriimonas sp.]
MQARPLVFLALATALVVAGCQSAGDKAPESPAPTGGTVAASTYADVKPILEKNCAGCHGAQPKEGYDVRTYESVMKGGSHGPLVKAGDPTGSLLVQVMRAQTGHPQMPPSGPLPETDIAKVEAWIKDGAKS